MTSALRFTKSLTVVCGSLAPQRSAGKAAKLLWQFRDVGIHHRHHHRYLPSTGLGQESQCGLHPWLPPTGKGAEKFGLSAREGGGERWPSGLLHSSPVVSRLSIARQPGTKHRIPVADHTWPGRALGPKSSSRQVKTLYLCGTVKRPKEWCLA